MADLERMIRERQDVLRGRPEDWIDRFVAWRRRVDWATVAIISGALLMPALILLAIWITS